jgi:hypothetical protein
MTSRLTRSLATALLIATAATLPPLLPAKADDFTASEIKAKLSDVAPEVLESIASVNTTAGGTDAIDTKVKGTDLTVPVDPATGVSIDSAAGPAVEIGLPAADKADDAIAVARGLVAYDNNNGSASLVKAAVDGSVEFLTVIEGASSPTRFAYPIEVSTGGRIKLTTTGGANILDNSGAVVSTVAPAWAKDANGRRVRTHYRVEGDTLVQYIEHRAAGIAYPVVADPWVRRWYGWDLEFDRNQTNNIMLGLAAVAIRSLFITDVTVSKIATAVATGLAAYANWVYNRGGCLKMRITYTLGVIPGHYYGGNCR